MSADHPDTGAALARLEEGLRAMGPLAVAVSGGVDSMTLAVVAHRAAPAAVEAFHAVSPAVPPEATGRVRVYAEREGWRLRVIDAGEMADPRYRENPANRCYFCKANLYGAMSDLAAGRLVSGTNTDDLGDYRPGLGAAAEHDVRHPYVEAGIDKATVRAIARALGLVDLAELPAAPCLSSRVETGIAIEPETLRSVHAAERLVAAALAPRTVRCRVRADAVVIEIDETALAALDPGRHAHLRREVAALFSGAARAVRFEPYRRGSAFLRGAAAGG